MESPIRSLLTSKQFVVVGFVGIVVLVGAIATLLENAWIGGLSLLAVLFVVAVAVADVHRKVGRAMAEARAGNKAALADLREVIEGKEDAASQELLNDLGKRIDATERARESTVSELSALRSQLLTRLDLLISDLSVNSNRLAKSADAAGTAASDLSNALASEAANLGKVVEGASRGADSALWQVKQSLAKMEQSLAEGLHQASVREESVVRRAQHELITEMDAILHVHTQLQPEGPFPLMGRWAISPVGMKLLLDLATEPDMDLIVECGSGTSTVLLALALKRIGRSDARIVSLEHLPDFADQAKSRLESLGLDEWVDVRYSALERIDIDGESFNWYGRSGFEDLKEIDLLLVDGPPGPTGHMARYPAFPLLKNSLSSRAYVVLDDTDRADERRIGDRWLKDDSLTRRLGPPGGQYVLEFRS